MKTFSLLLLYTTELHFEKKIDCVAGTYRRDLEHAIWNISWPFAFMLHMDMVTEYVPNTKWHSLNG